MPPQTNNTKIPRRTRHKSRLVAIIIGGAAIIVALVAANTQAIYDWYRLEGYAPPAEIAQLVNDDALTNQARRVFYVNHPALKDKAVFARVCPNGNQEAAVLGCYIPDQKGIYVLQVSDPALTGIEQVTTAHELLHAEYDRLDNATKTQVNSWLMDYYQHNLHDPNIIAQMNAYKKTEPKDLVDEMHSVFGTEVATLPANLESYYQRYFTSRSIVTGYYSKYENEFTSRVNHVNQDDAQLAAWKQQIDTLQSDAVKRLAQLQTMQQQLNGYRSAGNTPAYNAGVPAYNNLVDAYNAEVRQIHTLVGEYNQLVTERNAIALEEQQLVQDISSTTTQIGQ